MFPIQNGLKTSHALSPWLFNFAVDYAIGRVNQKGLKLNGTHQLQVHVDDNDILGANVHTIKENRGFSGCR
jgi:hypothetical protein